MTTDIDALASIDATELGSVSGGFGNTNKDSTTTAAGGVLYDDTTKTRTDTGKCLDDVKNACNEANPRGGAMGTIFGGTDKPKAAQCFLDNMNKCTK